ncbi:Uu.00g113520.m01.CDS01 [Anthostomella pinea]|uniref:Uu.00g113520.m01.CDS01 n=1 Tax=Anthostomella pinea TaxID=933095 RepID=A0AAI8YE52_9PEZI|nr:Uu.00g113520.m01.CDS01 [Anthostomella pinea]
MDFFNQNKQVAALLRASSVGARNTDAYNPEIIGARNAGVHNAGVHNAGVHNAGVHNAGVHNAYNIGASNVDANNAGVHNPVMIGGYNSDANNAYANDHYLSYKQIWDTILVDQLSPFSQVINIPINNFNEWDDAGKEIIKDLATEVFSYGRNVMVHVMYVRDAPAHAATKVYLGPTNEFLQSTSKGYVLVNGDDAIPYLAQGTTQSLSQLEPQQNAMAGFNPRTPSFSQANFEFNPPSGSPQYPVLAQPAEVEVQSLTASKGPGKKSLAPLPSSLAKRAAPKAQTQGGKRRKTVRNPDLTNDLDNTGSLHVLPA